MDKKSLVIMIILAVIVIAVIFWINYGKDNVADEETVQCIADNSQLFVKTGCPACASQKEILKPYLDKFDLTDCVYLPEKCDEFGITKIPTWIINGESYLGVHSVDELKELTGC